MTLKEYCNQENATRQPLGSVTITGQEPGVTIISEEDMGKPYASVILELTLYGGSQFTGFYTVDMETNRLITSQGVVSCFRYQPQ